MGGRSMKDVGAAVLAGSSPPVLGRERAAVDVDVGPERCSPRYHETVRYRRGCWLQKWHSFFMNNIACGARRIGIGGGLRGGQPL